MNNWEMVSATLHIGRSRVFQLWASGELPSVTIGRLRFSTDNQIDSYIRGLEMAAGAVTA